MPCLLATATGICEVRINSFPDSGIPSSNFFVPGSQIHPTRLHLLLTIDQPWYWLVGTVCPSPLFSDCISGSITPNRKKLVPLPHHNKFNFLNESTTTTCARLGSFSLHNIFFSSAYSHATGLVIFETFSPHFNPR